MTVAWAAPQCEVCKDLGFGALESHFGHDEGLGEPFIVETHGLDLRPTL